VINFCLVDKCKICNECFFDGKHKGHEIQTIRKTKQEAENKINDLESLKKTLELSYKELRKELIERKDEALSIVKENFEKLRALLFQKEEKLLAEITLNFVERIDHIDKLLGPFSSLYFSTKKMLSDFVLEMKKGDYLTIREENLDELVFNMDVFLATCRNDVSLDDEKVKNTFAKEINEIQNLIEKVNIQYTDPWKQSDPANFDFITPGKFLINIEELEIESNLKFVIEDNFCLKITIDEGEPKPLVLHKKFLEHIGEVEIIFNSNEIGKEERTVFRFLWENIGKLKFLKISFPLKTITDEILIELYPIIFSRIQDINAISINLKGSPVSDKSIVILFEKYIQKISFLEGLFLNLSLTKITSISIKALINNTRRFANTLIDLQLYLSQNKLNDEDMIPLFCSMPNIESFQFSLGKTQITDETLKALISSLTTMKYLQVLELHFWQVAIKVETVLELFQNINQIKKFYLNLRGVEINDEMITGFEKVVQTQMKALKSAFLYLDTGVSQKGMALLNQLHADYPYKA